MPAAKTKPAETPAAEQGAKQPPKLSPERAALAKKVVRMRKTKSWKAIGEDLGLTGSQLRRLFHAGGGVSTGERRVPKAKPAAKQPSSPAASGVSEDKTASSEAS